jgi:hypothetical protein
VARLNLSDNRDTGEERALRFRVARPDLHLGGRSTARLRWSRSAFLSDHESTMKWNSTPFGHVTSDSGNIRSIACSSEFGDTADGMKTLLGHRLCNSKGCPAGGLPIVMGLLGQPGYFATSMIP